MPGGLRASIAERTLATLRPGTAATNQCRSIVAAEELVLLRRGICLRQKATSAADSESPGALPPAALPIGMIRTSNNSPNPTLNHVESDCAFASQMPQAAAIRPHGICALMREKAVLSKSTSIKQS